MPAIDDNDWRSAYRIKRGRDKGSLAALRRRYWFWINCADRELREALAIGDVTTAARMMHACNQLGISFHKVVAGDEIEKRLEALESSRSGHGANVVSMQQWEEMHRNGE